MLTLAELKERPEIESHPGKSLYSHLTNTAEKGRGLFKKHTPPGLFKNEKIIEYTLSLHDVAKSGTPFQRKLQGEKVEAFHALESALCLLDVNDLPFEERLIAFEAVRRHHTRLRNMETLFMDIREAVSDRGKALHDELDDYFFFEGEDKLSFWLKLRYLYSLLVAADRLEASDAPDDIRRPQISFMDEYDSSASPIDEWRSGVFERTMDNYRKRKLLGKNGGVYSLTLPTGSGKTRISFNIAEDFISAGRKLIYVLPFITLVEQTGDVLVRNFGEEHVQIDHSSAFSGDGEDVDDAYASCREFYRYWDKDCIVTTMSHFWNVLFGSGTKDAINFHQLAGSLIIVDEPQLLQYKYWQGFGKMMDILAKRLNATVIMTTATQPKIGAPIELAGKEKVPYVRHSYKYVEGAYKISEITELIKANFDPDKSGMIVLNTKLSAGEAYAEVKRFYQERNDARPCFFLSSWVTPRDKRFVIKEIKRLRQMNLPYCLVATQVVEAGADLDFDWVIRDIAPLDAVIQCAGRCNRSFLREKGKIIICRFISEKGRPFSEMVYDPRQLDVTIRLLKEFPDFEENLLDEILDRYFACLLNGTRQSDFFARISAGEWDEVTVSGAGGLPKNIPFMSSYPLYNESEGDGTLIIEYDEEVTCLLEKMARLSNELRYALSKDFYEKRGQLRRTMKKLAGFSVKVSEVHLRTYIDMGHVEDLGHGLFLLPKTSLSGAGSEIYDEGGFRSCKAAS